MIKLAFRTCKQDFEDGFEKEEEVLIKAPIQSGAVSMLKGIVAMTNKPLGLELKLWIDHRKEKKVEIHFGIREYDEVRGQNTAKDLITACDQENYANFLKNKGLCLERLFFWKSGTLLSTCQKS